jgi:hypothetical protein
MMVWSPHSYREVTSRMHGVHPFMLFKITSFSYFLTDAIAKVFPWYMRMHVLMGTSPVVMAHSRTPFNLDIITYGRKDCSRSDDEFESTKVGKSFFLFAKMIAKHYHRLTTVDMCYLTGMKMVFSLAIPPLPSTPAMAPINLMKPHCLTSLTTLPCQKYPLHLLILNCRRQ